ncbi:hypothetical protein D3C85_1022580 [compost metagenome]
MRVSNLGDCGDVLDFEGVRARGLCKHRFCIALKQPFYTGSNLRIVVGSFDTKSLAGSIQEVTSRRINAIRNEDMIAGAHYGQNCSHTRRKAGRA